MESIGLRGVCIFGGYQPGYPRHEVVRKGLEQLGVSVQACHADTRRKVFRRYTALVKRFATMDRHFDVIYVPEFRHKDVPLAALLARLSGKLCVFDPLVSRYDTKILDRGDAPVGSFQSWHNRNLDRMSLRLPGLVLADTAAHARFYETQFLPQGGIKVLPVGYDETRFSPNGPVPVAVSPEKTVLFFGNYLPLHGAETIVRAAARLRDRRDVRFVMIGAGQTHAAARAIATDAGLDNVTFEGRVPIDALPGRIAEVDVCLGIFGRTQKAGRVVPNKVFQSMGMGKPVITADSDAIREFFDEGEHLVLVPAGDDAALAEAVTALCDDDERRARIGEAGRRRVEDQFTSERIAQLFVKYCSDALAGAGRNRGR